MKRKFSFKPLIKTFVICWGLYSLALSTLNALQAHQRSERVLHQTSSVSHQAKPETSFARSKEEPSKKDNFIQTYNLTNVLKEGSNATDYLATFARSLYSDDIVNPHNFNLIHEPLTACNETDILLLIYVHTAPHNVIRRIMIREYWGNQKVIVTLPNSVILRKKVMFVMGQPPGENDQKAIIEEAKIFGDILQEDFVDSYKNLTYKAICALKYVSEKCKHVPFVLKTDDDVFINMFSLLRRLFHVLQTPPRDKESTQSAKTIYGLQKPTKHFNCHVWSFMKVRRVQKSKWYMSTEEWRAEEFPNYCSGAFYLMTPDVSSRLYQASLRTPFFWVDDVYITGLLPIRMNFYVNQAFAAHKLSCHDMEMKYFKLPPSNDAVVFSHCPKGFGKLWEVAVVDEEVRKAEELHL